jgi:hypothetical protein
MPRRERRARVPPTQADEFYKALKELSART